MRCNEKELGMLVAGCGWGSGICETGSRPAVNVLEAYLSSFESMSE